LFISGCFITGKKVKIQAKRDAMHRDLFIDGKWLSSPNLKAVVDKFTGGAFATVSLADHTAMETAVSSGSQCFAKTAKLHTWQKKEALYHIAARIRENKTTIAETLCRESGKPIRYALGEVERAAYTFQFAAETLQTWDGDIIPLDVSPAAGNRLGLVRRYPLGLIFGISPFNFPLNLAAHKIAPSLATGNPIILKPASSTPLSVFYIADYFLETDLPESMLQIAPSNREVANTYVADERIRMISFTGSAEVGWQMKANCGKKKIALELGGNAGVYVAADANIDYAVERCLMGAFAYSGQVCISVQRIAVHHSVADAFTAKFIAAVKTLKIGNPMAADTDIGPMIDTANAERIIAWIEDARAGGAVLYAGGQREGRMVLPTVMGAVPNGCPLDKEEAFGPVVSIHVVQSDTEALAYINDSNFGLQAGIFSNNLPFILEAFDTLEVGGLIANDVPTFRVDNMPYGGVKESGFGREGLKYTMQEMTELRHLAINRNI
jgi:acyl-CoA reductase-like NAD-dependent aldehyde dehydrogenase